jgi:replicative DNA helicase
MRGSLAPKTVGEVLADLASQNGQGDLARLAPLTTGFSPLDEVLDGGLRVHDLTLVGGSPGVGKTIVSLQWARNMARAGRRVVYACYEHDQFALLARLLLLEIGDYDGEDLVTTARIRSLVNRVALGGDGFEEVSEQIPEVAKARSRLSDYSGNLWLVAASGAHTGLAELETMAVDHGAEALFVDYLQKVSVRPEPDEEAEKVTRIAEGLKEMALRRDLSVVAVVAADKSGLTDRRLRLHHFRGSSALAYECDVAIIVNEKVAIVSKVHLAYDSVKAKSFKERAVFSIEKNRGGPALIDLEFRKDFPHYRFDPVGTHVSERLVDERFHEE